MNAVYHRSYEEREPIEVRIGRDELVVLSFPGPDRSIKLSDFTAGRSVSRRYRNRRIGEFLKELDLTEGRSTGIPKILKVVAANGSPAPVFETDDERLAYVIRLPVHPLANAPEAAEGDATPEVTEQVTEQVTGQVTGQVIRLIRGLAEGELGGRELMAALGLRHRPSFLYDYLQPAVKGGFVEMTLPEKPRSSKQRYRLTAKGRRYLREQGDGVRS